MGGNIFCAWSLMVRGEVGEIIEVGEQGKTVAVLSHIQLWPDCWTTS